MESLEGARTIKKIEYAGKLFICKGKRVKICRGKGRNRKCHTIPRLFCAIDTKAKTAKPKAKAKVKKERTPAQKAATERMRAALAERKRMGYKKYDPYIGGLSRKRRRRRRR